MKTIHLHQPIPSTTDPCPAYYLTVREGNDIRRIWPPFGLYFSSPIRHTKGMSVSELPMNDDAGVLMAHVEEFFNTETPCALPRQNPDETYRYFISAQTGHIHYY